VIVLVLAVASVALALTGRYSGLWITGSGSLGLLILTFVNFQWRMAELKRGLERDLAGNPFRGIGELALQSVQLQWGWAVLVVGAFLLLVAAVLNQRGSAASPQGTATPAVRVPWVRAGLSVAAIVGIAALGDYGGGWRRNQEGITPTTGSTGVKSSNTAPINREHGWELSEGRSPIDSSETAVLRLEADNEIDGWLNKERPTLIIRCKERKTDLYVVTGMAAKPEYGAYESRFVRYRIDDKKFVRTSWSESTDNKALFSGDPVRLAKELAGAERFLFEFTPFNASPQLIQFPVKGLGSRLDRVARPCGWDEATVAAREQARKAQELEHQRKWPLHVDVTANQYEVVTLYFSSDGGASSETSLGIQKKSQHIDANNEVRLLLKWPEKPSSVSVRVNGKVLFDAWETVKGSQYGDLGTTYVAVIK